jgi:hypothetical protein
MLSKRIGRLRASVQWPARRAAALLVLGAQCPCCLAADPWCRRRCWSSCAATPTCRLLARHGLTLAARFGTRPIYQLGRHRQCARWPTRLRALQADPSVLLAEANTVHRSPEARKNLVWVIGTASGLRRAVGASTPCACPKRTVAARRRRARGRARHRRGPQPPWRWPAGCCRAMTSWTATPTLPKAAARRAPATATAPTWPASWRWWRQAPASCRCACWTPGPGQRLGAGRSPAVRHRPGRQPRHRRRRARHQHQPGHLNPTALMGAAHGAGQLQLRDQPRPARPTSATPATTATASAAATARGPSWWPRPAMAAAARTPVPGGRRRLRPDPGGGHHSPGSAWPTSATRQLDRPGRAGRPGITSTCPAAATAPGAAPRWPRRWWPARPRCCARVSPRWTRWQVARRLERRSAGLCGNASAAPAGRGLGAAWYPGSRLLLQPCSWSAPEAAPAGGDRPARRSPQPPGDRRRRPG